MEFGSGGWPLPDTREEILALATTLKADPAKDVFLGTEASKANVKILDLAKRKIVAFATHGLLPNDFPGVNEPSLALANPNDGKHGLLTLEDILSLKLDADWVVLSACNTAADKTLSRAQALRQSLLALMQRKEGDFAYAHPLFWAPYALAGDGGG